MVKMKIKEFVKIITGDEIKTMKELKLYNDVESDFQGDFETEIEFQLDISGFSVYEKNNQDNILLDYVDYENWFNVAEIEYLENEYSEEIEPCFKIGNTVYFLSDFMSYHAFNNNYKGFFDGYLTLCNFGGIEIKIIDDAVLYNFNW
jgi:hypothetical protein